MQRRPFSNLLHPILFFVPEVQDTIETLLFFQRRRKMSFFTVCRENNRIRITDFTQHIRYNLHQTEPCD